ncbi:MAG: TlpA disulfide reductase family protein [Bacteroidota bacterium]
MLKISKLLVIASFLIILVQCTPQEKKAVENITLKTGMWRGVLDVQGNELPFNFELTNEGGAYKIYLINDQERLLLDVIEINGDSAYIPMHIFDADIKAVITENTMSGTWTKNYEEDYVVSFEAKHGDEDRFKTSDEEVKSFDGTWAVTFVHEEDNDTTQSVGVFKQNGSAVTGTFLTPTGDYRFLEGSVVGDKLHLSTFDGGHAFLFTATFDENGGLIGNFWSGKSWYESWTATKDDNASLPDANTLTYIKEGYDKLDFSFPGLDGEKVSPQDDRFKGKVVLLQIFGTWCPNCMDETKFLKQWYKDNKDRGVEILGLAYEAKDDFEYAKGRIEFMKEKLDVQYDFVVAGVKDKDEASKTLPMLNRVLAYPTMIYLDKKGDVRKIHTGFTGPGTGHHYEQYIKDFNQTVDELLAEEG